MKQLDFQGTVNRMRYRAASGQFNGCGSAWENAYVEKCSTREGTTTLIYTRDVGLHEFGWLTDPAHDRCLHLSLKCSDELERNAWLRAFFGDNIESVWGMGNVTALGNGVWHWRLFCDSTWTPIISPNPADLLSARMHPLSALASQSLTLQAA